MRITTAALTLAAALYLSISLPSNAMAAGLTPEDVAALEAMRTGDMEKLVFHDEPRAPIETRFLRADGTETGFADFAGEVVIVNYWATWCPPCRAEMPSLDDLAGAMAGEPVSVVALSTDFGGVDKPKAFFEEIGIETLEVYLDGNRAVSREAGLLGLPVTTILDREGREVARLVGDAHWSSETAKAIIAEIVARTAPEAPESGS